MKNKGAKPKFKRKGSSGAFGCDLTEYLESSGQDGKVCQECHNFLGSPLRSPLFFFFFFFFFFPLPPFGSLLAAIRISLNNPDSFWALYILIEALFLSVLSCRTLEYLSKHLTHIASHSAMTNMHIRNLALVWAPNLLRSKEIEDAGCNGDAAFLEVRVQQVVLEFILNHGGAPSAECRVIVKSMTLPSGSSPMKLVSLQEAQAMSLSATHPARKERRENSLPEIVPPLFHTVIDLPENKRKLSTKSKKWKSIFNLGRSGTESKSKLSRNGSVFVRGQKENNEKATIRPAKSMDSLCSLPAEGEEEKVSRFKRSVGAGGFFIPMPKSRATGSGSAIDVRRNESEYEAESAGGATGGSRSSQDKTSPKTSQVKAPPEQMKVFRVGEDAENEQTSPKVRKMFYSSSDGLAKSSFPASLFPLEASPRHQRKAINISEPFAVSVPLRVSAVISSNSTPCRGPSKDRHFLSSLEELPLLEPDPVAKLTALENPSHVFPPPLYKRILTSDAVITCVSCCWSLIVKQFISYSVLIKDDDTSSINLQDPLWSDIQQELKIIESEEELPEVSEDTPECPEIVPPSHQEASISSNQCRPPDGSVHNPELSETPAANSFALDNVNSEDANQNAETKNLTETQLENITASQRGVLQINRTEAALPHGPQESTGKGQSYMSKKETWLNPENGRGESGVDFLTREAPEVRNAEDQTDSDCTMKVIPDIISLHEGGDHEIKKVERKSNGSLEIDEETGVDGILDEFWEDHEWVTSPLHSPKLKTGQDNEVPALPPKRRGTTGELYKRPEFTRSLSLDSKDSRTSRWTLRHSGMLQPEGLITVWKEANNYPRPTLPNHPGHTHHDQKYLNRPELPSMVTLKEQWADQKPDKKQQEDPIVDVFCKNDRGTPNSSLMFSDVSFNLVDGLPAPQARDSPSVVRNTEHTMHNFSSEESTGRPKTRPSSLTLDPPTTTSTCFTFESVPNSVDSDTQAQPTKEVHSSTKVSSSDRSMQTSQWKDESWVLHPRLPTQVAELDCMPVMQAPPGRRNSAPVSVSAVRASFMIKLCQAKAVPVIPPKVQYTQIPQPLQTVNADSEVPPQPEKKAAAVNPLECNYTHQQAANTGHNDVSKSPKPERKAVEEKENNDPVALDASLHSTVNLSPESNHNGCQDVPVLRRKHTLDGEAPGDTPLSSKIERPTLISKPSFRSRPGRPQSLILFSPPFPIMDHPSPADSRILLSPIKSQSQESTGENQRMPDGVVLRNKLTIPKNGQRLETSTSCFYQPQRRSVILDSRSGRQIE
uniref:Rho GTPase activating protein 31 n=1 Tax=Leptobrachium leishanense TaxID=445787 RepID=A0A8C5N070_9ANUR